MEFSPVGQPPAPRRPGRLLRGLAGAGFVACTAWAVAAPALPGEQAVVPGLAAPAEILVDRWGVPHIYAASTDDLFFAQGFNAARDRLFQIDLWRRRGLGRLAAVLGPQFVEQDRAARLFLYRGDMAREWRSYGPDAERIATRFVAGINAYIDLVGRDRSRLPMEFARLSYLPEKWQPEDVVRIRSHGLARNLVSEVTRALVACRSSLKADEVRQRLTPPWETVLPAGLDPCVPPQLLRAYLLGTQPVTVAARGGLVGEAVPSATALAAAPAGPPWEEPLEGSNAWVVAPARSATGRPILASDPHRSHAVPSLRYIVHLRAPGLDVIGGGEPALPGVSIGHNGSVAFGLTIFSSDQEDLYVYELNPERPDEVRHGGRWERLRTVRESIPVRGGAAEEAELQFTRHGPVLLVDRAQRRVYALRSAWSEPGTAPYFGSIGYMKARNFTEFKRAMATWGAPSENQLYADVAGNIGWVAGGRMPVRRNWDGLLPVPGDGRYEWAGFWTGEQLPSALNPAAGWIASANEMNLPEGYPARERKLGFEWPPKARWQRIAESLQALPKVSLEDSMRLQNDLLSVSARRVQAVLRGTTWADPRAASAARLLLGWDAVERGDSAAAALFELWWSRHLGPAVKDALAPRNAAALIRTADAGLLLQTLEQPASALGVGATARRDRLLEASLAAAWDELGRLAGPDTTAWRWDRLHSVQFMHPLANAFDEATRARLNVGPFPKQGGSDTVNVSAYDPATLREIGGPSLRIVLDVGQWDNSRAVNTPGQSGDPASPHYRDLAPLWLKGEYFPLLYSRPKVEAATERRIELLPPKPAR
ncbi:penicillin acylase family protein [Pelomonas sp. P7]|uniref:Penicillin acylase family protein n=1 Tax=Pelomonas caseinilytica TaxID=2906763 RepID=A0ABS8X9D8_9BURK|nr:penicillin acylase family protein [Pelomonas sp. P7]MCE4537454.1 penicillin acylase family protein [Pelomonas sp. P7]